MCTCFCLLVCVNLIYFVRVHANSEGTDTALPPHLRPQVQQRPDNKRIFGGWFGGKSFGLGAYTTSNGYLRGNVRGRAWMFRINPNDANKME